MLAYIVRLRKKPLLNTIFPIKPLPKTVSFRYVYSSCFNNLTCAKSKAHLFVGFFLGHLGRRRFVAQSFDQSKYETLDDPANDLDLRLFGWGYHHRPDNPAWTPGFPRKGP